MCFDEVWGIEEHNEFTYTSDAEWDRAEAEEIGSYRTDLAWVCTSRDVWHANPYYTGPTVPHPEEDVDF